MGKRKIFLRLPGTGIKTRAHRSTRIGALAQLGERLHGMQEVRGSIPLGSTKSHIYSIVYKR